MTERQHLHRDDCPVSLALLTQLLARRPAGAAVGLEATEQGAYVDWDSLIDAHLSDADKAVVHIAHGCAIAELRGGFPPAVAGEIRRGVNQVTRLSR